MIRGTIDGRAGRRRPVARVGWLVLLSLMAACSGARLDRGVQAVGAEGGTDGGAAAEATTGGDATSATGGTAESSADGTAAPGGSSNGATSSTAPGDPSAPTSSGGFASRLFAGAENTRGITKDEIRLCAHAALTYAAAFNTSPDDLNVYWTAVNDAGGVYGRQVRAFYENDNYTPTDAVKAATACLDKYDPFMLIGGIGFDQIPAVRDFAEQHRVLYFHHTATVNGSAGKQYSFTALPTTEKMGELFAELAATRFPNQPVGIVKRQSENWEPGIEGFKQVAGKRGVDIVFERPVPQNKGSYLQDIVELKSSGAKVVWLWLNALETTTFVTQAKAQGFSPNFMVFPFNLTTQTLGNDALNPPLVGINMSNAYSKGDYSGPFAAYADDMRQFEAQYRKYRPNVDVGGVGGDLLFLNWSGQKAMHQLLLACGPDCTRNRFIEILHSETGRATSSTCPGDFNRPGAGNDRRGGYTASVLEAYRAPGGAVNYRNVVTCVEHLL